MAKTEKRARRATKDVHMAILEAARANFARRGFGGASVKEIAQQAGVYEPMIYRRYPSKDILFKAAVLAPLQEVLDSYLMQWESRPVSDAAAFSTEDLVRSFVPPLYRLLMKERDLVLAFMSTQDFHKDLVLGKTGLMSKGISPLLERLKAHVEFEASRRPLLRRRDAGLGLLISFGMILGVVLLGGGIEVGGSNITDDEIVEEMVEFSLWGITSRAESDAKVDDGSALAMIFDRIAAAEARAVRAELELEYYRTQPCSLTNNRGKGDA